MIYPQQVLDSSSNYALEHPDYQKQVQDWNRVRDCMQGETFIKLRRDKYLPRPPGMSGIYADAYEGYIERAHFPQICSYALQGALGVIITKLPEFNLPYQIEYLKDDATKDGTSLSQLFLECIIEVLQTGKCVIAVDVDQDNKFKLVKYQAEAFINWKEAVVSSRKSMVMGTLREALPSSSDIMSHDTEDVYKVSYIDENGYYAVKTFGPDGEITNLSKNPSYIGKKIKKVPLFVAGSINNTLERQPIPLLSVANCSIQIYRKEADLANSEYLSCNPTLCLVGASNDESIPNVVGSSVMIVLPDPAARIFYTVTDTAALAHVKEHIMDLYDEAIRHGVAILDTRKGVEAAEALRIRQATQSASIYSMYLSVLTAIKSALTLICEWGRFDSSKVIIDAPSALTYGIPDATIIREVIAGFGNGVIPMSVIHRYLVGSGLIDQKVSLVEYKAELEADKPARVAIKEEDAPPPPVIASKEPGKTTGKVPPKQKPSMKAGDPKEKDNVVK